jgi:hypothetical protein
LLIIVPWFYVILPHSLAAQLLISYLLFKALRESLKLSYRERGNNILFLNDKKIEKEDKVHIFLMTKR